MSPWPPPPPKAHNLCPGFAEARITTPRVCRYHRLQKRTNSKATRERANLRGLFSSILLASYRPRWIMRRGPIWGKTFSGKTTQGNKQTKVALKMRKGTTHRLTMAGVAWEEALLAALSGEGGGGG